MSRSRNDEPHDLARGVEKYLEFNSMRVRRLVAANKLAIPAKAHKLGKGHWITYRSDKWNDGTHDYIHHFKDGVHIYSCEKGGTARVPQKHQRAQTLVKLGQCLGVTYHYRGVENFLKGKRPMPTLYCTPSGKALFVVQGKDKILLAIWGGKMGVEARGIVN